MKNALVLSGGNVKGAYQAGAISALFHHTFDDGSRFEPDGIFGVSVGAMNGAFLADRAGLAHLAGQAPDWPQIADDLVAFWIENITSFSSIGKKRSAFSIAKSILFGNFNGLTSMKGAEKITRNNVHVANLKASPVYFSCGVMNMASGNYFNADVATFQEEIIDHVIASTREPVKMPLMWVNDQPLADGGVRNIAPLSPAIKMGAEKMAIIALKTEHIAPKRSEKTFTNIINLLERTISIMTNEIINNDLNEVKKVNHACAAKRAKAGQRVIEFAEIRPENKLPIDPMKFDTADIKALVEHGKADAKKALEGGWQTD